MKVKKIFKIILDIFTYSFVLLGLFVLIATISLKKNSDDKTSFFNYEIRLVVTNSMEKNNLTDVSNYKIKDIKVDSLILIKKVNDESFYENIEVGDVLTFKYVYTEQVTITHRVSKIMKIENGGYLIELIGDNRNDNENAMVQYIDTSLEESPNYIIGKVVYKSFLIGKILTIIKKPIGIVLLLIIPSFIIILLEIIKIVNIFIIEKRKKELFEKEKEILDLKNKLNKLENKNI